MQDGIEKNDSQNEISKCIQRERERERQKEGESYRVMKKDMEEENLTENTWRKAQYIQVTE